MGKEARLASFCRLCLTKSESKVAVFAEDSTVDNLLGLIEIEINPTSEPDAVVCYSCIVTLEGFYQFKEQCHVNDDFIKNIPNKSGDEEEVEEMESDYLIDYDDDTGVEEIKYETAVEFADVDAQSEEEVPVKRSSRAQIKKNALQKIKKWNGAPKNKNTQKSPLLVPKKSSTLNRSNSTESLEISKVEEECAMLNVPTRPTKGPTLDEMLVLADSYPEYFFFEKGKRSVYYTMVYYGERYNSALFTEHYTYWQCRNRRKYNCPARVVVTNDYKTFERRYEHTHAEEGKHIGTPYSPLEVLPLMFETCRKIVLQKRARRRSKLVEKYKSNRSKEDDEIDSDEQSNSTNEEGNVTGKSQVFDDDGDTEDGVIEDSDYEY